MGDTTTVAVYRLMQFTLRDVLIRKFDPETAGQIFFNAGREAGLQYAKNILDITLPYSQFVAGLQQSLKDLKIGILRIEKADIDTLTFEVSVYEDLDCSGLPMSDETVCDYDEGFLAGVFEAYTGKVMTAKEVDCWAMGGRTCRFEIGVK